MSSALPSGWGSASLAGHRGTHRAGRFPVRAATAPRGRAAQGAGAVKVPPCRCRCGNGTSPARTVSARPPPPRGTIPSDTPRGSVAGRYVPSIAGIGRSRIRIDIPPAAPSAPRQCHVAPGTACRCRSRPRLRQPSQRPWFAPLPSVRPSWRCSRSSFPVPHDGRHRITGGHSAGFNVAWRLAFRVAGIDPSGHHALQRFRGEQRPSAGLPVWWVSQLPAARLRRG